MSKLSADLHENDSTTSTKSSTMNPTVEVLGKVLVKAQFNEDIRRVPIHNEDITYDELVLMMQRVFRGQLKPDDDIIIKYQDEDGDMVTIFDSADLSFAITYCRVLKLKIIIKDKDSDEIVSRLKNIGIQEIRKELKELRDRANKLLDVLDAEVENRTILDKPSSSGLGEADKAADKSKVLNGSAFTGVSVSDQSIFGNSSQPSQNMSQGVQQNPGAPNAPPQSLTPQPSYGQLPSANPNQSGMQQPGQGQHGNLNLHHHNQVPQAQTNPGSLPGSQMQNQGGNPSVPPGQAVPSSTGLPQQAGTGSAYPPSSTPSGYGSYNTGYGVDQQYMMGGTPGYPATSASSYMRSPNTMPAPRLQAPTGQQQPPPMQQQPPNTMQQQQPPSMQHQQQPPPMQQQQQGQHAMQSPPTSYPGYQAGTAPINMPPMPGQAGTEQGYGNPPPPPMGAGGMNQYRMSTSGSNIYGRPQAQMGYK